MQNFKITREMLLSEKARTYVPAAEKLRLAEKAAVLCVSDISAKFTVGAAEVDLPDFHGKDTEIFSRLMLGALYHLYLGQDIDGVSGDGEMMALDDYDRAGAAHPLNTMVRFKGDPALRDLVYDLLADYKELREMADRAVADRIAALNDPVSRFFAAQTMAMTPEALGSLSRAEKALQKQVKSLKKTGAEAQAAIAAHGERKKIPEV